MPPPDPFPSDVHQTAVISKTARIGKGVVLGAFTVIEDEVNIGDGTKIAHNVVVGRGSKIGNDCRIFSNVTIYYGSKIGNRVIIHSGTVVGSDGFGFAPKKDGTYEKIPQLGIVHIEDDVELGANLCIDRATLGETRICKGVKLDNLIQVAHNCYIGENTVMAALSGLAGTTKVGKNVMVGGNVGMAGHLEIADKTVIMAKSGVSKSITEPGKTYFGVPAKEAKRAFRIESMIRSLPELAKQVSDLEKKMKELEAELAKWSETK
jgi:UDP-3-O-[3-hydroxymyristoyl] glucosamine N-acyltransferase